MLVLISGLPGSGKSFFARKFAGSIGANYFNSDEVRIQMHSAGKYSDDDKAAVYKELELQASKALRERHDVVVDATFYRRYFREIFEQLSRTYSTPLYIIVVRADESTIRKRLSSPREFSEADFQVYETIRDQFEEITVPHLVLTSTDYNLEEMLRKANQYILHDRSRNK